MKTIWKFPLEGPINTVLEVKMPEHAKIISMQAQRDMPTLWALVDTTHAAMMIPKKIYIAGTGHELPDSVAHGIFHGTFQVEGHFGIDLVFHVFEIRDSISDYP